ncbi:MAG: TonB-dependent receptor, partial [Bryobacteraceae bacterium]
MGKTGNGTPGFSGRRVVIAFAWCLFALTWPALAQDAARMDTIQGTVVDSTGGAVVGAHIALLDDAGRVKASAATNSEGHFLIPGVLPGKYLLQTESKNFDTVSQELVVSSTATVEAPLLITMRVAAVRQTVNVVAAGAYAVPEASGATKTGMPIMETPVSVQVIPQPVLEDQQIVHLDDALQNVSGVIPNNDSYGTNDSFSIRGFDAQEMTYEDGLRLDQYSTAGFPIDMANVERVEVVKGPASVLYGQAEPGGVVNIVTKKPLGTPYYSLQQQFGSYDFYRTTFDATGPLFSKQLFYRFVLDYENAGSFRDFVYTNRVSLFPSVQWRPTDKTQVT